MIIAGSTVEYSVCGTAFTGGLRPLSIYFTYMRFSDFERFSTFNGFVWYLSPLDTNLYIS